MDALLVGVLTTITAVLGVFWWNILTRPELILSVFHDANHSGEGWFEHHPGALGQDDQGARADLEHDRQDLQVVSTR